MNGDQWERAKEIFDAALKQAPGDRHRFVILACHDDPELLAEITGLLQADAEAGSFLDNSAPDLTSSGADIVWNHCRTDVLPLGEVISGRFEIRRFVGQGGMGQVYEAKDIELGICVALKTIRPEISANGHALTRFKKEVQLTRLVTHPNVCRVFDLGRHVPRPGTDDKRSQPFAFLTMELLEGDTLSDLLRRKKRLLTTEALPITEQVAEGLAAAHRLGIVHRDIKPSNILLVPNGNETRAVITDFGLARTINPEKDLGAGQLSKSVTGQGNAVGTLAYMAPEQLTGAAVTPATDIYAFGLVIYEIVTGVRPFDPTLPLGGVPRRLNHPPPSPRIHVPDLDLHWEAAILHCLQVDPGARFQNARQVVEAIKDTGPVQSMSREPRELLPPRYRRRRQRTPQQKTKAAIFLTILLLCVALFGLVIRLYQSKATIPEGSSILVTDIGNETQDPEINAVTEVLRTQLSQSGRFDLLEREKVREILARMGKPYRQELEPILAREVAWRAGGSAVVYGSVAKVGPGFSLDLRLETLAATPDAAPVVRYTSFPANDKTDLFHAIQQGSKWIRETAGDAQTSADRPPEDTTTSSWQALLLFSRAEQLKSIEHTEDAVRTLRQAVSVDPHFALAYMRLGDLSNYLGNEKDGIQYWRDALVVMKPDSLTRREELRIRGLYSADTGDYKTARGHFQSWELLYPRDYLPSFYLAGTLISEGRYDEAIDKLNEAEEKQPSSWYVVARRARCRIALGRFADATSDLTRLTELGQRETVAMLQASLAFLQGDYDVPPIRYEEISRSADPGWQSLSYSLQGSFLSERGDYIGAVAALNSGIAFDRAMARHSSVADKEIALAYIYYRQVDFANCKRHALAAVIEESGVGHLLTAGTLLARCNAPQDAERLLQISRMSGPEPVFEIARNRVAGEILLANNKPSDALSKFKAAAALEDAGEPKEYLARALSFTDRQAATVEYRKIIDSPGQIWQEPELHWPGLLGDSLQQYLMLGRTGVAAPSCLTYMKLRPGSNNLAQCSVRQQ